VKDITLQVHANEVVAILVATAQEDYLVKTLAGLSRPGDKSFSKGNR
jgi:hypothetical protein